MESILRKEASYVVAKNTLEAVAEEADSDR